MRVHKKSSGSEPVPVVKFTPNSQAYEVIYENVKEYLVFKISITKDLTERKIYLDILNYMERIQLELKNQK